MFLKDHFVGTVIVGFIDCSNEALGEDDDL